MKKHVCKYENKMFEHKISGHELEKKMNCSWICMSYVIKVFFSRKAFPANTT